MDLATSRRLRPLTLLLCSLLGSVGSWACGKESLGTATGGPGSGTASGPGGAGAPGSSTPGSGALNALATEVQNILKQHCLGCHGAQQTSQGGLGNITSLENLISAGYVIPRNAASSKLYQRVSSAASAGRMPPPPAAALSATEISAIEKWINAGAETASKTRTALNLTNDIIEVVKQDVQKLSAADRSSVRYFTLWPTWNLSAVPEDTIVDLSEGLAKFVNSVSLSPNLVKPVPIGPSGAVFRIRLQDLGWSPSVWQVATGDESFFRFAPEAAELRALMSDPAPIARIDEFIAQNSVAPRYYAIQGLKLRLDDFLKQDLQRNSLQAIYGEVIAGTAQMKRLAFNNSQVADFSRVIERHRSNAGRTFWMSSEFGTQNPEQDPFQRPFGPAALALAMSSQTGNSGNKTAESDDKDQDSSAAFLGGFPFTNVLEQLGAGGAASTVASAQSGRGGTIRSYRADGHEVIFEKPNGMLGFYVAAGDGKRINEAPTGVRDSANTSASIAVGASCMRCHYDGVIRKDDQLLTALESNTTLSSLFSQAEKTLLGRIYVREAQQDFESDRSRFQTALRKIGVNPERQDPIHRVRNAFIRTASRAEVAALLQVSETNLNAAISKLPSQVQQAWTALLTPGGEISRSSLTTNIKAALAAGETSEQDPSE